MRRYVRRVHLALALTIGLFVTLSGLSGSILVFHAELDRALKPWLLSVPPRDEPMRLDASIAAVRAAFPDDPVRFARLARAPGDTFEFWIGGEEFRRVYVDPYEARIIGTRGEHPGLIGFVEDFHEHLLSGATGTTILGVVGLLLLALLITGLVLWWPGLRRLGQAFRVRRGGALVRTVYDLHRITGVAAFLLLGLSALTGAALVFHNASAWLLISALGGPSIPRPPSLDEPVANMLPASALLESAQTALPEATPTWIMPPSSSTAPFLVRLRFDENPHPNGMSFVAVHPGDGRVMGVHSHRAAGPGQRAADLRYPLHTGDAFGLAGRIATLVIGLAPGALLITGLLFWLRRRSGRRRRSSPSGRRSAGGQAVAKARVGEERS